MVALLKIQDFVFRHERANREAWTLSVPNFELRSGQVAIVSGDNMSGKTTFLLVISGMLSLENAMGKINNDDVVNSTGASLARKSIVLSSDDPMFAELTVEQNITIAVRDIPFEQLSHRMELAKRMLLGSGVIHDQHFQEQLGTLSSGGRALVKLARAHLSAAPIIIVDEISSFLDSQRAAYFLRSAIDLAKQGRAIVIVSHNERDRELLREESDASLFHIYREENLSRFMEVGL